MDAPALIAKPRFYDWWIAQLARCQHGVVARWQLLAAGIGPAPIKHRLAVGRLHEIQRGVYAVGHRRISRQGEWMAAVLAGGPGAVLSHQSAAMHWRLIRLFASLPHVTTAAKGRKRSGLHNHTARLRPDEITIHEGIPVTTVARTLLDLAAVLDRDRLERAIAEAEYRQYADSPSLHELIERYPGRPGTPQLRLILGSRNAERGITVSPLEDRFLPFLDAHGIPRPETNAPVEIGPGEFVKVDCLWRADRLAVELDGRAAHIREMAFESDRVRDRRLTVAGWHPLRLTEEQIDRGGAEVAADLRALLPIATRPPGTRLSLWSLERPYLNRVVQGGGFPGPPLDAVEFVVAGAPVSQPRFGTARSRWARRWCLPASRPRNWLAGQPWRVLGSAPQEEGRTCP